MEYLSVLEPTEFRTGPKLYEQMSQHHDFLRVRSVVNMSP